MLTVPVALSCSREDDMIAWWEGQWRFQWIRGVWEEKRAKIWLRLFGREKRCFGGMMYSAAYGGARMWTLALRTSGLTLKSLCTLHSSDCLTRRLVRHPELRPACDLFSCKPLVIQPRPALLSRLHANAPRSPSSLLHARCPLPGCRRVKLGG